jgi:hypothetical protein
MYSNNNLSERSTYLSKYFSKKSSFRKKYWPFSKARGIVLPLNPEALAFGMACREKRERQE